MSANWELRVEGLRAKARGTARGTLGALSFALSPGVHAIFGTPDDGTSLLLAVMAGEAQAQSGSVWIGPANAEAEIATHGRARRSVAYIPRVATIAEPLRVAEFFSLADSVRADGTSAALPQRGQNSSGGGQPAHSRLARVGMPAIATRRVDTLTREEQKALLLAEALTSDAVSLVLIDEPFAHMDGRAAALLPALFEERAQRGTCIVFATASLRDAQLSNAPMTLFQGRILEQPRSIDPLADALADKGASVRIVSSSPRPLLAALSAEEDVLSIVAEGPIICARGRRRDALAAAVQRAILTAEVPIAELSVASNGDAQGFVPRPPTSKPTLIEAGPA